MKRKALSLGIVMTNFTDLTISSCFPIFSAFNSGCAMKAGNSTNYVKA
jgi:hypothetical protein